MAGWWSDTWGSSWPSWMPQQTQPQPYPTQTAYGTGYAHGMEASPHLQSVEEQPFLDAKGFKQLQSSTKLTGYSLPPNAIVIYTDSEIEADRLLQGLLSSFDWSSAQHTGDPFAYGGRGRWGIPRIVGLDMEWRGLSRKPEAPVALVQISSQDTTYLLHVCRMSAFPTMLSTFLQEPRILKAGLAIENDAKRLRRSFPCANVVVNSCIELSRLARAVDGSRWPGHDKENVSLQRLVHAYDDRLLDKDDGVRCGDWEGDLDACQRDYAAKDAHASFILAYQLLRRAEQTVREAAGDSSGDCDIQASRFAFDVVDAYQVLPPSFSL